MKERLEIRLIGTPAAIAQAMKHLEILYEVVDDSGNRPSRSSKVKKLRYIEVDIEIEEDPPTPT